MGTIHIIESETKGLSPLDKNFQIVKVGNFSTAKLTVNFTESWGYKLQKAFLNGVELKAQTGSLLTADVKNYLKSGDNKLSVIFDALQVFGQPLGQATISAYVEYSGASVVEVPSVKQAGNDIGKIISDNVGKIILITIAGAAAAVGIGYTMSRLPNFGGIDVKKSLDGAKSEFVALKNQAGQVFSK